MSHFEFEEEEFDTQFNGRTVLRILAQARPHWRWLVGFVLAIAVVAAVDSYLTFLSKQIVDKSILDFGKVDYDFVLGGVTDWLDAYAQKKITVGIKTQNEIRGKNKGIEA